MEHSPESFKLNTPDYELASLAKRLGMFEFTMLLHAFAADQALLTSQAEKRHWQSISDAAEKLARLAS